MAKKTDIKKLTAVAMLSALAYLCMFIFKFKVQFLTFDFKDAILAVNALLFGPLYGLASAFIVAFVEAISVSDTGVYGFIMNFLSSSVFAVVCGVVYKYKRTLLGAVLGVVSAVFSLTAIMLVANLFITPFYMNVDRQVVVQMLPTLILPFNFLKGVVNAAITMIIYKPITIALKKSRFIQTANTNSTVNKKSTLFVILTATTIFVVAILVIIYILHGQFLIF